MRLVEGIVHVAGEAEPNAPEAVPVFDGVDALVAELDAVAADGVTVQAFDAGLVVDRRHLERAVELADRERERGEGIARGRAVEVLLYAAGRRQIDRALEMGVSPGATRAVVLVASEHADADEAAAADAVRELVEPAETLGDYDESRVRAFFDIDDAELAATDADLPALVRERVALLVVNR
ncbi:KEOPS complex subunit Cgi121 [Haloglomus salinum]|uniref:KEOPS complex subunit Cgi121 n=1 Tax=Haloglomus salinum TaxID=2962673 RepID=UPI0020C9F7FD|nr:KEOPS complex subunit Cgi121 [Haloglomus salinum]